MLLVVPLFRCLNGKGSRVEPHWRVCMPRTGSIELNAVHVDRTNIPCTIYIAVLIEYIRFKQTRLNG
jgi:hypothetical protein